MQITAQSFPPPGQVELGVVRRDGVEAGPLLLRHGDPLVLKDKVVAADDHLFPADPAGDAVGHDVADLGVLLLVLEAPVLGRLDHGVGHGMGVVLLQAGGQAEHLRLVVPAEGDDPGDPGRGVGQGAGLVKDDGVRLGHGLQELAALDGDPTVPRLLHG